LILAALGFSACSAFGSDDSDSAIEVIEATDLGSGEISLLVSSCNAAPVGTLTEQLLNEYLVEVEATQDWDMGEDCADLVTVFIGDNISNFVIEDAATENDSSS